MGRVCVRERARLRGVCVCVGAFVRARSDYFLITTLHTPDGERSVMGQSGWSSGVIRNSG